MATITFKGDKLQTFGELPSTGTEAPDFTLTGTDLSDVKLSDYKGKKVILNIFPSLDTSVCATSVRKFNEKATKLDDTVVICISKDLPFAHSRFCSTEGIKNVINASQYKDEKFGNTYGVTMNTGPLAGLFSRAIVTVDKNGKVVYTEQVPEIGQEPDYDKAIESVE